MNENALVIPKSIQDDLPAMVRNELAKLSAQRQEEFVEEFRRKARSTGATYAFWFFLGCHYAYLRRWGVQLVYWFTGGGFLIWAFIDLFRIRGMVTDYNKDVATDALRNLKAIAG